MHSGSQKFAPKQLQICLVDVWVEIRHFSTAVHFYFMFTEHEQRETMNRMIHERENLILL